VLLQSPIFHAYVLSIYIELEREHTLAAFSECFAGEHIKLTAADEELPNNVNVAGEDDILVSVRPDITRPNGFWLWAAADNLKLAALTAVDCAAALALTRSRGSVQ
jgi:aspartate-semialdehyde dehydrogenase